MSGKGKAGTGVRSRRGAARRSRRPPAQRSEGGCAPEVEDDLAAILEAMLFAAHEPLPLRRLAGALGKVSKQRVADALESFQNGLTARGSPLQLVEIAGGYRLVTRPEFAPYLARLFHKAEKERLSAAALETLAIIAYRQPVTRGEIESIRGVQAGPVVRVLQDRRLIKVVGRAPIIGRPRQFGTTKKFLDHFGLNDLEELPRIFGPDEGALVPGRSAGTENAAAGARPEGDRESREAASSPDRSHSNGAPEAAANGQRPERPEV